MMTSEQSKTYGTKKCEWHSYVETKKDIRIGFLDTETKVVLCVHILMDADHRVHVSIVKESENHSEMRKLIFTKRREKFVFYPEYHQQMNEIVYNIVEDIKMKPQNRLRFIMGTQSIVYGVGVDPYMQTYFKRRENPNFFEEKRQEIQNLFQKVVEESKALSDGIEQYQCTFKNIDDKKIISILQEAGIIDSVYGFNQATFYGVQLKRKKHMLEEIKTCFHTWGIQMIISKIDQVPFDVFKNFQNFKNPYFNNINEKRNR